MRILAAANVDDTEARRRTLTFHHRNGSGLPELRGIGTSERERAALAVVADGGFDAGLGRRRRLVDLPVLAAVPGEHAERQHHRRLRLRRSRFLRRVSAAHGRGAGAWAFELNIAAMALAGVDWLTLVLGMRWQLRTKAVAALSGLATLALAGATAIGDAGHGEDGSFLGCCCQPSSIELSAVVALVAISAWQSEAHGRHIRRLAVVLWGTTAFGVIHVITEYPIIIRFSDANWDFPPGMGLPHRRHHHHRDHEPTYAAER